MGVSGQLHAPAPFIPWDIATGTYYIEGLMDPGAGLEFLEKRKIITLVGIEHRPTIP
jgi:hypothetical protein